VNVERNPQAWNELAWARLVAGEPDVAVEYARRAHELDRRNVDYLNTLGVALAEAGDFEGARTAFRKALKIKPGFVDALANLGKVLEKQEDIEGAAKAYRHALALAPSFPKLAVTLARICRNLGRADEARDVLASARDVPPEDMLLALAERDFELDGEAAALDRLRTAVHEHPEWRLARGALAHLLLATAHWREGWSLYREPPGPIDADRVLLRGEQGIGDVLFFLRFAPALRARGVRIALACEKKLHSILSPGSVLDEIREDTGEGLRVGDLPLLVGSEDPPPAWPLQARGKAELDELGPPPYLGVTWRAGTDVARRRELGQDLRVLMKSAPPALLGRALRGWPGTLILLQRNARPGDVEEFGRAFGGTSHDLSSLGDDLPQLLRVLAALDEYVGVSNANMHFLAGLGKTARVLVPYPGEWRWMRRPGPSPWFPGFAVYRQPQSRDWAPVLEQLRADLFERREKR
jgi:tetratricopeptide (TPR) repeat protein